MAENIYMYQEEETDENMNLRQKANLVISKVILKWLNLKTIKKDLKKVEVNLRRKSNYYKYNVVNDFKWIF